ncbi:MAG: bifunctional (p)ppGpp synthetase/guanosine-3',5'-bis(diphosphate) 3'-pyrophosphohydrolase [Bacillota bacterium]|nr:bifunctional (p)ppGpp synthetase/guanosine-3',5'-bis(diphosphate) 3'-pyrophosphohydrolase [Bacillota bacterium]
MKITQAHYQDYEELVSMLQKSEHSYNFELIDKAYKLALEAHGDQRRVSGVPYILHPTSVACILADLGMDTDSIVAALLHDVVEDTEVTIDDIKAEFGNEIAQLIDGVTKLGKIPYSTKEEQQSENLRKMLIAMADDIRVIIIKLADRLHNMRTIDCMREQKRRDKALENMEVFAPIAHRLGITTVKEELEDLSLRYLDPVGYSEIEEVLARREIALESFVENIKNMITERTIEIIPNIFLEGRVKSINGIYRKTYMQGKTIDQIFDIVAVRVIVDTIIDCYNVLGIIHDIFQPLPNRFKDYISTPKNNMYQSLHTTVIDKTGIPFEVQIRTWEMHHTAEYGIAAHWKYKLGIDKNNRNFEERLKWIRNILENEDATDLVRNIKSDLSDDEVYVFTPKGDVINLPKGSTVIDMAYAIHSAIGNRMIGAKVDKRIVPIDYKVKTGEIIEIITTKEETQGPKRDWLKIVRTSEARNKIRQWFKKEKREENIIEGKSELERELRRISVRLDEKDFFEMFSFILKKQHCNNMEDFYAAIGYGGIQLWRIMPRIKEEFQKKTAPAEEILTQINDVHKSKKIGNGVIVEGIDDVLIKFSKCCNPLPGDDIIGFITRGYGVSIHKRKCNNVPKDLSTAEEPERWVHAHWEGDIKDQFQSTLEIVAIDRNGLLADITNQLFSMHIFVQALNYREIKNNRAVVNISITVNDLEHLKFVMSRLQNVNGIVSIGRS